MSKLTDNLIHEVMHHRQALPQNLRAFATKEAPGIEEPHMPHLVRHRVTLQYNVEAYIREEDSDAFFEAACRQISQHIYGELEPLLSQLRFAMLGYDMKEASDILNNIYEVIR